MIASIVWGQLAIDTRNINLIVVDSFHEAKNITENIRQNSQWNNVFFANDRAASFEIASRNQADLLLIDGEIGVRLFYYLAKFKLSQPKCKIAVYEEGAGTYRNNIYTDGLGLYHSVWKGKLFPLLGVGVYFGGSYWCDEVYVFDAQQYKKMHPNHKKPVHEISQSLINYILSYQQLLKNYFPSKVLDEIMINKTSFPKCVVYFSSWDIYPAIETKFQAITNAVKICKLHPHIKDENAIKNVDYQIESYVPAELLLLLLLSKFKEVIVYHHGSSLESYMDNNSIHFKNILMDEA